MKKRLKHLTAFILSAVLSMSVLLSGCGSKSAPDSASDTGSDSQTQTNISSSASSGSSNSDTLTWILTSDINSLDPSQAYDDITNMVVNQITEGLLTFDHDNKVICSLAESWECADPLTYIYNIRSDIKFSDGNPMTMEDVIFSLERHRDPATASLVGWMFDCVDTIEQTGDWQITVKLSYADATWQYVLATTAGHVIEKSAYEADQTVVGTGAYVLDSWTNGNQIVLTRNANYSTVAEPIFFNKVVFNIISEDTTRVEALTTGQADLALNPPLDMMSQLEASDNVVVNKFETFGFDFLAFNTCTSPFNDVNVRKAVACAIDTSALYTSLLSDTCSESTGLPFSKVMYSTVGSDSDWEDYAANYDQYPADMEKAKAYMAASAYPDGFTCRLAVDETSLRNSEALYIQATLAELGINVEIERMSYVDTVNIFFGGIWDSENNCRDYDMLICTWYSDYPDISGSVVPIFYSANSGVGGSNLSGYANSDVDAALDTQLSSIDTAQRIEMLKSALDQIGDDVPMLVLDYPLQATLLSSSLDNVQVSAAYFWNLFVREMSRK